MTAARGAGERDLGGRPAVTTAHELAAVAQRLFLERGFERTSIDDIAAAAGIGRRTFFRYFRAKVDVLFAESASELEVLRRELASACEGEDYRTALVRGVTTALRVAPGDREWALQRAQLILSVPALQAQAAVVFAGWRSIATEYVAGRFPGEDLFARAAGHAVLAATLAAHEHWITHPGSELEDALRDVLVLLLPREPVER
ncbi:TetR family transcriptional regulator [Blastococcus sp. URHD0036]|uniref:acyl-CoA-like ligand-binding transcription factor n=1 Tax=Blastococcus sp. URHD0036 TaxID=1380356 RepID=UPI000497F4AE|nr:TetR family transcriptional regulator [Blastococcus sp. URHD0036]